MDEEDVEVRSDLKDHLVVATALTCQQLLKLDDTAFTLYLFYTYTSCWQGNVRPKATDTYCMKGLKWGKEKFYKAKKMLTEARYIETIHTRDSFGKMVGSYIKLHFQVVHSPQNQRVVKPEGGFQETNTLEEREIPKNKLNTIHKESSMNFLRNLPDDFVEELHTSFDITKPKIRETAEKIIDWCEMKGRKYKNYKSALRNWIRKDFPVRVIKPHVKVEESPPDPNVLKLITETKNKLKYE